MSVEALEVHYRIHASILKYLELHEGKPILSTVGKIFKKCLNTSLLPKKNYGTVQKTYVAESKTVKSGDVNDVWLEVKECMEALLSKVEEGEVKVETKVENVAVVDNTGIFFVLFYFMLL